MRKMAFLGGGNPLKKRISPITPPPFFSRPTIPLFPCKDGSHGS